MKECNVLTVSRSSKANVGIATRSGLALFAIISIGFAWLFVGITHVSATGIIETSTQATPWAVAFDKNGHVWVAEPGCDAEPHCSQSFPSYIGEYNTANNTLVKNF